MAEEILIVDDEPRIRDLIRAHLEHEGFSCEEAGDGGAALAALSGGDVDLVILDIMMPFVDGMTCLKEMRSRKITTPVRSATLIGTGGDILQKVDMVGNDYALGQGFCFAASGALYIGAGQPTVRVTEMTVGGDQE